MNIIQFPHDLDMGGVQVVTYDLLTQFKDLGHNVMCVSFKDGIWGTRLREANIPVVIIEKNEDLIDVAKNFSAEVVQGHTCCGGSYACTAARKLGIIGGETIHSCVSGINPEADFEISFVKLMTELRPKVSLIYLATNSSRIQVTKSIEEMKTELGLPHNVPVIGRNGRIVGAKNPLDFVKALELINKSRVVYGVISGSGEMEQEVKQFAENIGISDRLIMSGETLNIGNILNILDVFVYPTSDEMACAAVTEAMLFGLPVVAYMRGGMNEFVIEGQTGFQCNSPEELSVKTLKLLDNKKLTEDIGKAAKDLVMSKGMHSIKRFAEEHLEVYKKCLYK